MKPNRILTMAQAISEGIAQEMTRDANVFVMGEDIASYGGIFGATGGLLEKFGKDRIMDPRDEGLDHFCAGIQQFFAHADPRLRQLAERTVSSSSSTGRSRIGSN